MYYTRFRTSYCDIILVGHEKGLVHLHLDTGEGNRQFEIQPEWTQNPNFFSRAVEQIRAYLAGRRTSFDLTIAPNGTAFQQTVWNELCRIPYGELRSYGDIARAIGKERNAARAVGAANGKNPIPLVIPCHRVVGADGSLTGFAHGLSIKEKLIRLEQETVSS